MSPRRLLIVAVLLSLAAAPTMGAPGERPSETAKKRLAALVQELNLIERQLSVIQQQVDGLALAGGRVDATHPEGDQLRARLEALRRLQQDLSREVTRLGAELAVTPAAGVPDPATATQAPPPGQVPGKPPEPTGLQPLDLSGGNDQVTSGTAFNPAMSVVPDMLYYSDTRHGNGTSLIRQADGFDGGYGQDGGDAHGASLAPGFNLRELEVALSGAVDPYFDAVAIIAIGRDGVGLEEVFVRVRRLPAGLQVKAGKFYSDVGYINRQHPHQ
jgi:hypothetical protein